MDLDPSMYVDLEQAANRIGIPVEAARDYLRTGVVRGRGNLVHFDDLIAVHKGLQEIPDLRTLVREFASLKVEVIRQRQLLTQLLVVAGLQNYTRQLTDIELLQFVKLANERGKGLKALRPIHLSKVEDIADIVSVLTDRDLQRIETLTKKKGSWVCLIHLMEDLDDHLAQRPDLLDHPKVGSTRMKLNLSLTQLRNQAKFLLALQAPFLDPKEVLRDLCLRAAKLPSLKPRSLDPGEVLARIAERCNLPTDLSSLETSLSKGRCPDAVEQGSQQEGSTDRHEPSHPASSDDG